MRYELNVETEPFETSSTSDDELEAWDGELTDLEEEEETRRGRRPTRPTGFRPRRGWPAKPPKRPPPRLWPSRPSVAIGRGIGHEPAPCVCPAHDTEFVRWVQSSLNQVLGLNLPVSGVMNAATRGALRRFQKQQGLPVDGIAGPETERALIEAKGSQPGQAGEPPASGEFEGLDLGEFEWEGEVNRQSPEYVRWVQQSLNQIMGLRLAVDGITGPMTRSAIRSFQQRQGLSVDGIVGSRTEAALIASGASPPPTRGIPSAPTGRPDIDNVRGIRVARQIAAQVEALLAAAQADGIRLGGGGYRSPEAQVELRKKHCGTTPYDIYEKPASQCVPPTAPPGKSMHEKGLAIDFTYNGRGMNSRDNPGFQWLSQNAARFGLYNLPSEPWHWSINGR